MIKPQNYRFLAVLLLIGLHYNTAEAGTVTPNPPVSGTFYGNKYICINPKTDVEFSVAWTNGGNVANGTPITVTGPTTIVDTTGASPLLTGSACPLTDYLVIPTGTLGNTYRCDMLFDHPGSSGNPACSTGNLFTFYIAVQKPVSATESGSAYADTESGANGMRHTYVAKDTTTPNPIPFLLPFYKVDEVVTLEDDVSINGHYIRGTPYPFVAAGITLGKTVSTTDGTFTDLVGLTVPPVYTEEDPSGSLPNGSTIVITVKATNHAYTLNNGTVTYALTPKFTQTTQITSTKTSGTWSITSVQAL